MVLSARIWILALLLTGCSDDGGTTGSTTTGPSGQTGDECVDDPAISPCDGECVNLQSDPMNCGACGNQCASNMPCLGGVCEPPCSDGGGTLCGAFCVQLETDPNNCGSCDNACDATQTCVDGVCEEMPGGESDTMMGTSAGDSTGTAGSTGTGSGSSSSGG